MKKWFKQFNRNFWKEGARRLGVNLVTASLIGGFITHISDMTMMTFTMLIWLMIIGSACIIFGIYKV